MKFCRGWVLEGGATDGMGARLNKVRAVWPIPPQRRWAEVLA